MATCSGRIDGVTAAPTLFRATTIITMDPAQPRASAILVDGDRILAVGVFEDLDSGSYEVDDTFADDVVCAGFIDQHLHPVLGATTLVTEVIATGDWAVSPRVAVRGSRRAQPVRRI